jgi:hypothetical protein
MIDFERKFFQANIEYIDPVTKEVRYLGIFPSMWKYFLLTRS